MKFLAQPHGTPRLGDFLKENLEKEWPVFRAAIAFVKRSGTRHIAPGLKAFSSNASIDLLVGIDHSGTSKEGLEDLLDSVGESGRVVVFHNPIASTFHPKVYLFRSETEADVMVGSGNMTQGGLFTNYEAAVRLTLDLKLPEHKTFLTSIETALDSWSDLSSGLAQLLDATFLTKLVANGYVPVEALAASEGAESRSESDDDDDEGEQAGGIEQLFKGASVPSAPSWALGSTAKPAAAPAALTTAIGTSSPQPSAGGTKGFVMTLQNTDVGTGQVTVGTTRRSPEIFIPLAARDQRPSFWDWPNGFTNVPKHYVRNGVKMRMGTTTVDVNMMSSKLKHDLRLRSEALRSAGAIGDILRIELPPQGSTYDYYVEVIPAGTTMHPVYDALCTQAVGANSKKRFGYY